MAGVSTQTVLTPGGEKASGQAASPTLGSQASLNRKDCGPGLKEQLLGSYTVQGVLALNVM